MTSSDTIFALSSAPGKAGVAVVRVSGEMAQTVLRTLTGDCPVPRKAALRTLRRDPGGRPIDQALVLWFPGPHSFTGENCAEFQVHGGAAVLAALFEALERIAGCRLAEPGEFARRAFFNGKLDLTQAEGLADLIDAQTEAQRHQALSQAGGTLFRLYENWRTDLIDCLALQEASIDFSDEPDVTDAVSADARLRVSSLQEAIAAHLNDGNRGEILRDGFKVVLAGPPNAGKSSLLNALARRDVAIVSTEPGTTRDVIEVRLDLEGLPVVVSDTAGIRGVEVVSGEIEKIGIERTKDRARSADLVLWLSDAREPAVAPPEEITPGGDEHLILPVRTKADLLTVGATSNADAPVDHNLPDGGALISIVSGTGLTRLTARIAQIAHDRLNDRAGPALTQTRHRHHLQSCQTSLQTYLAGTTVDSELRAEDLRQAALALGRITGHVDVEDVLDRLFSNFCIGK